MKTVVTLGLIICSVVSSSGCGTNLKAQGVGEDSSVSMVRTADQRYMRCLYEETLPLVDGSDDVALIADTAVSMCAKSASDLRSAIEETDWSRPYKAGYREAILKKRRAMIVSSLLAAKAEAKAAVSR